MNKMTNVETCEKLNKILEKIYNALDEVGDIEDNQVLVANAERMLLDAAVMIEMLQDDLEEAAPRSGAV